MQHFVFGIYMFGISPRMQNETTNCDPNKFQTIDADGKIIREVKNSLSVYASTNILKAFFQK